MIRLASLRDLEGEVTSLEAGAAEPGGVAGFAALETNSTGLLAVWSLTPIALGGGGGAGRGSQAGIPLPPKSGRLVASTRCLTDRRGSDGSPSRQGE